MKFVPDSKTLKFYLRYFNIIRFAGYEESFRVYSKLINQYDHGTGFVVLPMDMHYVGAGKIKSKEGTFEFQMNELVKLKSDKNKKIYPFVFIDPRRIKDQSDFLKISGDPTTGIVMLKDCLVKEYIETNKLNGFKIYPALGYYPFDEELLLLWKYAADHQIPIMTHVIKGTVFYRDDKKKEWDYHPVFEQYNGKGQPTSPLMLPELKNIDFSANFTHPLNYLCLLDEKLLRKVVKNCRQEIKDFFGYSDDSTELKHNLSKLKICMGHYGGDDEWAKYQERDRLAQVSNLLRIERDGFDFFPNDYDMLGPKNGYLGDIWKSFDWFSIITNLMYKYKNVYADISYIVHNPTIYPLLKQILGKDELKDRVLYGTDFFVVRNHKSEKQLLSEVMANLTEEEFDLIARDNPRAYLKTSYCTIN
ncbi:MAG: amidohydrolase family protein [Saprospiraceae bacterium]|nr:amidohydrolase family protein [Saprospiraceae bacterium]